MSSRRTFLRDASLAAAATLAMTKTSPGHAHTSSADQTDTLSLFELRNYRTKPGGRDVLIDLFEREFLDAYESGNTRVIATFRNLDDPHRWVWIRAFRDNVTRSEALHHFYASAVWQRLRSAANATIVDASDALLLTLAHTTVATPVSHRLVTDTKSRPKAGATSVPRSVYLVMTWRLPSKSDESFAEVFAREAVPALRALDAEPMATLTTDHRPNLFTRQKVRDDETVFVALTRFATAGAYETWATSAARSNAWQHAQEVLARHALAPAETLRLQPTARSGLR